jgi:hypothetical protein
VIRGGIDVTRTAIALAVVLSAAPVWAQSVYVGGAVAAEVVRTSSTKSGGTTYDSGSGEAFGGAIRVGTFLTSHVGVELEYFRPGEIDADLGPIFLPAATSSSFMSWSSAGGGTLVSGLIASPPIVGQTTRVRTSTTSALLTARQSIGRRVAVVYLGGVGFSRVVREVEYSFPRLGNSLPGAPSIPVYATSTRTTQYAAGPVVGAEVRAAMTDHAQVIAGLRVHTLGQSVVDGWMIRPNVGLAWQF